MSKSGGVAWNENTRASCGKAMGAAGSEGRGSRRWPSLYNSAGMSNEELLPLPPALKYLQPAAAAAASVCMIFTRIGAEAEIEGE